MSGTPLVGDWLQALDSMYPSDWAEPGDNPGLQVGDVRSPAVRVLVALDPVSEVVAEAADRRCGVVVTHHPLLHRPLERLDLRHPVARAVAAAAAAGVAVIACHTNADVARPGVSDVLAETLGVQVTGVLRPTDAGSRAKLVTFVPPEATEKVLDAMVGAGASSIGEYSHCSFRVRGTGTFLPSERAHPVMGERGELNEVEEDRLEAVVPRERLAPVIEALIGAHPYEEVVWDAYLLEGPGGLGLGRTGRLAEPTTAEGLAELCRERLRGPARVAGEPRTPVTTVAVCGGSGASLADDALRLGVDALVTGDVKHHPALEAAEGGLALIDAGHHGTEWPFVPHLAERLRQEGPGGEVLVSEVRTDPFGS